MIITIYIYLYRQLNNNEFEMMTSLLCKTITCSIQGGNYSTNVKYFISFVSRKILLFEVQMQKKLWNPLNNQNERSDLIIGIFSCIIETNLCSKYRHECIWRTMSNICNVTTVLG